jgi:hypothetical protein
MSLLQEIDQDLAHQRASRNAGGKGRARGRCLVKVSGGDLVPMSAPGSLVTPDDIEGIYTEDVNPFTGYFMVKVTMKGARLFLRMYEEGGFALKRKRDRIDDANAMKEYIASEPELIEAAERTEEEQRQTAERRPHLVEHPEQAREEEFSVPLLSAIFRRHIGPGEGVLSVGGVEVHKILVRNMSDSGKNSEWSVRYNWTYAEGHTRSVGDDRTYANNRGNDADRNWGLRPE